jgi:hypothetical protein
MWNKLHAEQNIRAPLIRSKASTMPCAMMPLFVMQVEDVVEEKTVDDKYDDDDFITHTPCLQ